MDSIDSSTLDKAGEQIDALDRSKVGDVHTVTITTDGHTGRALVKVETTTADDITFVVGSSWGA